MHASCTVPNHGKKLVFTKENNMRKVFLFLAGVAFLTACGNNDGQTGVMNDGMKVGDTNGGLADTAYSNQSATDTSKLENRVDISTRDTFENNPNR